MWAGLTLIGALLFVNSVAAADFPVTRANIFKGLHPGQRVNLAEAPFGTDISLIGDGKVGAYNVLELGESYIVLEDISHVMKIWIPVTSIRRVSWLRLPIENPR